MGNVHEHLAIINEKNFIIKGATASRTKRGVFWKTLAGSAIAVVGGAIFEAVKDSQIKSDINDLNEKTLYMQKLLNAHTSILNLTENIQESTINEANFVINQTVNMLQNETKLLDLNNEIHWMSTQLLITMIEFQKLQEAIVDGNHEGRAGINSMWISYDKMNNQISLISDQLPNGTILFGNSTEEKLVATYKLSTTRMLVTEQNIIFAFEIPLFHSEVFKCYEIIPLPIELNNSFIWIDNIQQYLWLTSDNASYALASGAQMEKCTMFDNNYICEFGMPVRSKSFTSCEFYLYLQNPVNAKHCSTKTTKPQQYWNWIKNKWIFSVPTNTTVTMQCHNQTTAKEISGSGYIDTHDYCKISTNEVELSIYDFKSKIVNDEFHFGFFAGEWEDQPVLKTSFDLIHSNFTEIRAAIEQLKDIRPGFNVPNYYYSAKTMFSIALIIILCITLSSIYIYRKCSMIKKVDHSFVLRDLNQIKRNSIQQ